MEGGDRGCGWVAAQEIECATVLLAVDDFFRQLGLAEIRLRSSRDDKPLRMVKTLLHELCKKKVCYAFSIIDIGCVVN